MKCPICQNLSVKLYEPFCSKTCKNIDLLRWMKEDYRIPQEEEESPISSDETDKSTLN